MHTPRAVRGRPSHAARRGRLPPSIAFLTVATAVLASSACSATDPAGAPARSPTTPTAATPTLTYLGVAGWKLTDGAHTLLVDPYFSRIDADAVSGPLVPDAAEIARLAPARADVILVGHSHYDHALDVADVARRTGAVVVGTESTMNLARAGGVDDAHRVLARGAESFDWPPFAVRSIPALHSVLGMPNVPIPANIELPMPASGYTEGGTLQYLVRVEGRNILFVGTANFVEDALAGVHPDVAVLATGRREAVPDYTCRLMRILGQPPLVLTNHFDEMTGRLTAGPSVTDPEERKDLDAFAAEVHGCSPSTRVVVPDHLQTIAL